MRRIRLAVYALIFLIEVVWLAIVPVTPLLGERLALSKVELGVVLGSAGFATLLFALPLGIIGERVSARTMMVAASLLLAGSTAAQGVASNFLELLAARGTFGISLAIAWTAGVALLSDTAPTDAVAQSVGGSITVSGAAFIVAPAFAGVLADRFGIAVPFLAMAAASLLIVPALVGTVPMRPGPPPGRRPFRQTLDVARREPLIVGSIVVVVMLGIVSGGINLLVPLHLRADGMSAASIGIIFSTSAAIYTVVSAAVARLGSRLATLETAGLGTIVFGSSMLLLVASSSAAAAIAFVLIRAPFWAALSTISYPLGALGARRLGVSSTAVMALVTVAWAVANVVGPPSAGLFLQVLGGRLSFVPLILTCSAAAAATLGLATRRRTQLSLSYEHDA